MKHFLRITLFLITTLIQMQLTFGQMQDLTKLANGELVFNDILWDENGEIYGYFYLFENDVEKDNKTMNYVILDKNLNKAFNGAFTIHPIQQVKASRIIGEKYYNCSLMGTHLLLSKAYYYNKYDMSLPPIAYAFQTISLNDKSYSVEKVYYQEAVQDLDEEHPFFSMKEKVAITIVQAINNSSNKGFFVTENQTCYSCDYLEKEIKFLDTDTKLKWTYNYNPNGSTRDYYTFSLAAIGRNYLYLLLPHVVKSKAADFTVVAIDFKTGKEKYKYLFEDKNSKYSRTFHAQEINNQLVIVGNYSDYNKRDFQLDENRGYFKLVLDEEGKEVQSAYTKWSNFSKLNIDEDGRVEKNFRLRPTKFYFFKDGKVSILTEKYKPEKNEGIIISIHVKPKTSDFILFNMNKEFETQSLNIINKELSKTNDTDYLFHQYIKDENGVAFFYGDYRASDNARGKNWILGINTIINGQLTEEKIPISSKNKYFIQPYPAKEGYIMLREFNKENKYNQVRLEKLNY